LQNFSRKRVKKIQTIEDFSAVGTFPVHDLFSYLQGDWVLTRKITDLRLNTPGLMSGTTTITRQPDKGGKPVLAYKEEGELSFGEYKDKVYRNYEFCFPVAHKALVLFSDGKIFHELDLSSGFIEVEHLCLKDTYRGSFCVVSPDAWLSKWQVSGPSKELILDNHYQRRK
jgi:hypothetical protein